MMKIKTAFLLLFLSALAASWASAADIVIKAQASKSRVALNDSFVYSVTVEGDVSDIPEPQIGDISSFNRFAGGKSQSISIINGKVSVHITYNYTLGPKSVGRFTIPAARLVYNNRTYTSQAIDIEVIPAQSVQYGSVSNRSQAQPQTQQQQAQQTQGATQKRDFFVRATVSKKNVYENEKLVYKFSFYTSINLMSNPDYFPPDFAGFWNDGSIPINHVENINGTPYMVNEIETTLYPITSGEKTIMPTRLRVTAMMFPTVAGNVNDLMQAVLAAAGGGQAQTNMLETRPLTVNVLPLPKDGRPHDFYGAVGKFKIEASINKTQIETNEPIALVFTVTGEGNMKSVTKLDIAMDQGIRKYDTVVSQDSPDIKVFTTLISALTPGEKIIPAVRLSFFNPNTRKYETVLTQPIVLNAVGDIVDSASNGDISKIGIKTDIGYNKDIKDFRTWRTNFIGNRNYLLAFIPLILLFIGGCMFNLFGKSDSAKTKGSIGKAAKMMTKAQEDLAKGNLGGLFDLVYKALLEAIDSKTGIPSEALQEKQILENLKNQNVPQEAIDKLSVVFERINFYKFAAVRADEKTLKEMLVNVNEIIGQLG